MTGKIQNKKELQKENNEIKKELSDVKNHYANLLEEYRTLEAKTTSSIKCSECEKKLESFKIVKKPQENHRPAKDMVKCDHCEKDFNEIWKLNAHLKRCKVNKCDVCDKTFKYTDLLKKHILIAHENFKIYCHFFNNEKSCPNKECVFLHEDSPICKYDSVCERQYCMYKHGKKKESIEKNEECDDIVVVEVEIMNVDDKTNSENDDIIGENDTVVENNVDEVQIEHNEENDVNVKIVDVEDDTIDYRTSDIKQEESDNNIPEKIAGSFACNICNVAAKSKHELVSHKVSTHNWCIKCFSTFDSRDNLKNHLTTMHKKK